MRTANSWYSTGRYQFSLRMKLNQRFVWPDSEGETSIKAEKKAAGDPVQLVGSKSGHQRA